MIETVNPATGEVLRRYERHDDAAVGERLARAWSRWQDDWGHRPLDERLGVLAKAAEVLEARRDDLAGLVTAEMGKPITAARAEVDKCVWLCRHYAEHSPGYLAPEQHGVHVVPVELLSDQARGRSDLLGQLRLPLLVEHRPVHERAPVRVVEGLGPQQPAEAFEQTQDRDGVGCGEVDGGRSVNHHRSPTRAA